MTEPWEPYYRIAPETTPNVRKVLEDSLRFIAGAADGEGMALMRKAYALNKNQPIEIQAMYSHRLRSNALRAGIIQLELGEIDDTRFGKVETMLAPSVTGFLVHEMYHKADPNISLLHAVVEAHSITGDIRNHILVDKAREFALALQQNDPMLIQPIDPAYAQDERAAYTWIYNESNRFTSFLTALTLAVENAPMLSRLQQAGFYVANVPRNEDEAVRFTDAFMAKNGCNEPMRLHYHNTRPRMGEEPPSPPRAAQCSGLHESPGFTPFIPEETLNANALGDLTPPQVKPLKRDDVQRGK